MANTLRRRYGHAASAEPMSAAQFVEALRSHLRIGELKAMFFSGGNVGVGMPRAMTADEAGDKAAAFYRDHVHEFDSLYKQGYGAVDAARGLGNKHGVRHFR